MNINESMKLLIKVRSDSDNSVFWKHFCYINRDLYLKFVAITKTTSDELNKLIATWSKNSLGKSINIVTEEDLESFKNDVREYYKKKYPSLYQDSCIDHQGWVRVWITENMKEVVENGKSCE